MVADLVAEATRLQHAAAEHKRLAGYHRRRLSEAMTALASLKAECARRGIRLVLVPQPHGEGDDLHGRPAEQVS